MVLALAITLTGCKRGGEGSPTPSGAGASSATSAPSGGSTQSAGAGTSAGAAATTPAPQEITTPSGLKYQDVKVGDGTLAENGMTASVHYTGWLTDGTKFDSSLDRGQPFSFRIGAGQVIRGWDEGVRGMRVGGKRKLTIPPDLGYGDAGTPGGPIPPKATLVFDVELIDVH
jgi:FKBP-type peptidyl-prolyl cis-trans isomerase